MPTLRDRSGRFISPGVDDPGVPNAITFTISGANDSDPVPTMLRPIHDDIFALPPVGAAIKIVLWGGSPHTPEFHIECTAKATRSLHPQVRDQVMSIFRNHLDIFGSARPAVVYDLQETVCCNICLAPLPTYINYNYHKPHRRYTKCMCCNWFYPETEFTPDSHICKHCQERKPYIDSNFSRAIPSQCSICNSITGDITPEPDPELPHVQYEHVCHTCRNYLRGRRTLRHNNLSQSVPDSIQCYTTKKAMPTFLPKLDPSWLYMGVELETDMYPDSNQYHAAKAVREKFPLFLTKSDSSLTQGVEIVSEPATLTYHKTKMGWPEIQDIVRAYKGVSHKSAHCGLHVHVNKNYFGVPDSYLWTRRVRKMLMLVYRFQTQFFKFSRRSEAEGSNPCAYIGVDQVMINKKRYGDTSELKHSDVLQLKCGRYGLNLSPPNTIEFRFFRGTLKASTFFATLEFVDLICHIAKFKKFDWVKACAWADLVALTDAPRYQFLTEYLKERGIDK